MIKFNVKEEKEMIEVELKLEAKDSYEYGECMVLTAETKDHKSNLIMFKKDGSIYLHEAIHTDFGFNLDEDCRLVFDKD